MGKTQTYRSIMLHSNDAEKDFDSAYKKCKTVQKKMQICLDHINLAVEMISKSNIDMIVGHYKALNTKM